jgi:hypothetical protein
LISDYSDRFPCVYDALVGSGQDSGTNGWIFFSEFGKPAKFEDIKVGDWVSGTRLKKSDTEYEVLKITKFGPKTEKKPEATVKPAEKKAS